MKHLIFFIAFFISITAFSQRRSVDTFGVIHHRTFFHKSGADSTIKEYYENHIDEHGHSTKRNYRILRGKTLIVYPDPYSGDYEYENIDTIIVNGRKYAYIPKLKSKTQK